MNRSARRITAERGLLFGGAGPTSNGGPNGKRPCVELCNRGLRAARGVVVPKGFASGTSLPCHLNGEPWRLQSGRIGFCGRARGSSALGRTSEPSGGRVNLSYQPNTPTPSPRRTPDEDGYLSCGRKGALGLWFSLAPHPLFRRTSSGKPSRLMTSMSLILSGSAFASAARTLASRPTR